MKKLPLFFLFILCLTLPAAGQGLLDLETGVVTGATYNRIRVPGSGGTLFNAAGENFSSTPVWFYRIRAGYTFADRHTISLLYAPLTVTAESGSLQKPINFEGVLFPAGDPLRVRYTFNSYRLTYRYDFVRKEKIRFGAGLTGKIRDAAIRLENSRLSSAKTNVGFVPLINFYLDWGFAGNLGLLLEGDALAAPQGRAEDIFAGVRYRLGDKFSLKAGYRLLEGGADNDEVYNFTWLNYLSGGLVWRW